MFFTSDIIIFLQRTGLLVAGKRVPSAHYVFPTEVVNNLEVLDRTRLIQECQQFFTDHDLHGKRVLLVLDYSVVFEKTIELDKTGQPDKLLEGFVAAMPFEVGTRACLGVETGAQLRLFATNATLYNAIDEALRSAGISNIAAITPIAAYDLAENERTVSAATGRILKDKDVPKHANFHSVTPT